MDVVTAVVPAQAGTHRREARGRFSVGHRVVMALARGLCLADPWVPAFAGTASDRELWARMFTAIDET